MVQSILVAFDGSTPAERAIETAVTSFVDPEVTVIHVLDPGELVGYAGMEGTAMTDVEYIQAQREEESDRFLASAEEIAAEFGVEVETVRDVGDIANTVVRYAEEEDMDHVVVGSHGRKGVRRLLLGSVAERIVRRSPISVTVAR